MEAIKIPDPGPISGIDRLAIAVATAGGAGFLPVAPGTAGSLVGLVIYLFVMTSGWGWAYLPLLALLISAGVWSSGRTETIYGHDASKIVIDEVVGQMTAFGWVAYNGTSPAIALSILGFLLFRLFDILKPYPLGRLELLPRGFGVVADDVGAGTYTIFSLMLLDSLASSAP